jgi:predicted phage tail protein
MMHIEPQPLVTVHLYGALAEKYGTPHAFAISTPREAVRAFDANFPGFRTEFLKEDRYIIVADGDLRDGDVAADLTLTRDLHLIPKIGGEAPLIGLGLTAAFGLSATAATIIGSVILVGVMLGLSLLLKPKAKDKEDEKKDESYAFSGPENVTQQGVPVPLIYGRVFAGSVVISAGLSVSEVAI